LTTNFCIPYVYISIICRRTKTGYNASIIDEYTFNVNKNKDITTIYRRCSSDSCFITAITIGGAIKKLKVLIINLLLWL
jgi:hypothetical protein